MVRLFSQAVMAGQIAKWSNGQMAKSDGLHQARLEARGVPGPLVAVAGAVAVALAGAGAGPWVRCLTMGANDELRPLFLLSDEPIGSHATNAFKDDRFARTVASAALGTTGPFTIGVYGGWGTGKTSALHAARTMIDASSEFSHVVTVEFNAWRFEREAHPIVPLVATIERAVSEKAAALAKNDPRTHADQIGWYKKAGMQCRAFLAGWQFKLKPEIGIPFVGKISAEATWTAKDSLQRYTDLQKELKNLDGEYWSALRESCLSLSVFDALDNVGDAVAKAAGPTKEFWPLVVVFIDDLDRCQADKAFELLESVKLVLCQPGFVFVLALNHAVVDGYLTHRAEKLYGVGKDKLHRNYLEKIVQLPLAMPSRSDKFTGFVEHLLEQRLSKAVPQDLRDEIKKMTPLLALAADATPRTLVRTINGALLDIALRDPTDFPAGLKNETPPYPVYSGLCIVQRALERSIGVELTKELARQQILCDAILKNPAWGAYDAVERAARLSEGKAEDSLGVTTSEEQIASRSMFPRLRPDDVKRLRGLVTAILDRPFLWEDQRGPAGKPIAGTALLTSEAGKFWLGNAEHRLAVMKAAVAVPLAEVPSTDDGGGGSPVQNSTSDPVASGGQAFSGVDAWMRDIATLGKEERSTIEYAARSNLRLAPNARLDAAAWGRVKDLPLSGDPITDSGALWLARADMGLRNLTSLRLHNTRMTIAGIRELARTETGLKGLTTLSLRGPWVTDVVVRELARADTGLNSLNSLDLGDTAITDAGVKHLANADTGLKALTFLDISVTGVTDEGVNELARADTGLNGLTALKLSSTQLTDAAFLQLARPQTGLKGLTGLDLSDTRVSDGGLTGLVREDTGLKALATLRLTGTDVTDEGVAAVKYKRPGIKVIR